MLYVDIMRNYTLKTHGKVVEIEVKPKVCNQDDDDIVMLNYPIVEYKPDEEKEVNRQSAIYDLFVKLSDDIHILYPQKALHVGDEVTVRCNPNGSDKIFACPNMPFTRLFCKMFIPGIIYLMASLSGVCYVFV